MLRFSIKQHNSFTERTKIHIKKGKTICNAAVFFFAGEGNDLNLKRLKETSINL